MEEEDMYEDCVSHAGEAILVITTEQLEFTKIAELQELWEKINILKEKSNQKIKEDIEALQCILQELEDPHEKSKLVDQETELTTRCEETMKRLGKASEEGQQLQSKVKLEEKEKETYKKTLLDVTKNKSYSLPKAKYNVNLYCNISNIRWQLDSTQDDIKGYVCKKSDVQPFSLNTKQHSKFYVSNYLWDLMEEDW
ncbi:kinetochore protein spc24 [Patella vulgata]|uniref:kinetochore protein spc24 n=1 Tax=Patella vulgata TaxID=6465 RepID=UPI00217F7B74|nr:kinetochore protein spc24 [Patella vulgata]